MESKEGLINIQAIPYDGFQFEEHCKSLDDALNELKKYLDKVLEMRLHCAELELEISTLYKPDLIQQLMKCQKTCSDCKGLILIERKKVENNGGFSSEIEIQQTADDSKKLSPNLVPLQDSNEAPQ